MKQLSFWALMNPYKAQFIITISQLILSAIAIYSGIWLFAQDIILPNLVFYIGLTLFFVAFACYPIRRARYAFWKSTFAKQKIMDTVLLVSYLLTAMTVSNRDANIAWKSTHNQVQKMQIVLKTEVNAPAKSLTFKEKLIKKYVKFVIRQKTTEEAAHAGLVFLILILLGILATVLMYLVLILSCDIFCSGGNIMGLLLLLGGWVLIITGAVYAIRALLGKRKKNYEPMPTTPEPVPE